MEIIDYDTIVIVQEIIVRHKKAWNYCHPFHP